MNPKLFDTNSMIYMVLAVLISAVSLNIDGLNDVLQFDRQRILDGEVWRLITGHFIHLNAMHWLLNALGLSFALYFFQEIKSMDWFVLSVLSSVFISCMLLIFDTDVAWYLGFSGVLHSWFIYGTWHQIRHERRVEGIFLLALILIKVAYEQWAGASSLSLELIQHPVIENAHLYGVIFGVVYAADAFAKSPILHFFRIPNRK